MQKVDTCHFNICQDKKGKKTLHIGHFLSVLDCPSKICQSSHDFFQDDIKEKESLNIQKNLLANNRSGALISASKKHLGTN